MQIRNATYEDITAISVMLNGLYQLHEDNLPQDFKSPKDIIQDVNLHRYIDDDDKVAIVACHDESMASSEIIGIILGEIWQRKSLTLKPRAIAIIMDIAVAEHYQSQGIGKKLYYAFEQQMKSLNAEEVMVEIYDFNKKAITFYQGCGIKPYIQVGVKKL